MAAAVPVLLAAYVLSAGPIVWLVDVSGGRGFKYAYWAYKPLRMMRWQFGSSVDWLVDEYPAKCSPKVWQFMYLVDEVRELRDEFKKE